MSNRISDSFRTTSNLNRILFIQKNTFLFVVYGILFFGAILLIGG